MACAVHLEALVGALSGITHLEVHRGVDPERRVEDASVHSVSSVLAVCSILAVCAVAAILAAAIGMSGVFVLPPLATTACRWIAVWGMISYVMLSFAFSRASERMSKRRVLASRVVVILVVLVVMMGFVGFADALG